MIQANASPRLPDESEAPGHLASEAPERPAVEIVAPNDESGLKVLGDCCGTDDRHIAGLADRLLLEGR